MYMLSMGPGMNMGFPDVCLTPTPVPVPTPYPDTQFSTTSEPTAVNILVECMPAVHQLSMGLVSVGDDTGLLLGVVSHMISGQTMYIVGSLTVMVDGVPAQRLTSVTGQNCMEMLPNAPGVTIVPSQTTVLTLA